MKKLILPTEIEIHFHPSHFLWGCLAVFSILLLGSVAYSCSPAVAIGIIGLYGLLLAWQCLRLPAMGFAGSIQRLRVDVYGDMTVTLGDGQQWLVAVGDDSLVHPCCISLRLHYRQPLGELSAGRLSQWASWRRPRWLLLLPDHAGEDQLHALRVWLRWGRR